jgi:hypothetical protein
VVTDAPAVAASERLAQLFGGLRHRDYAILLATFLVTQTGCWLSTVGLQWQTARLTDNDPFLLGALYFCDLIPLLVLSPIGGALADRSTADGWSSAGSSRPPRWPACWWPGCSSSGPRCRCCSGSPSASAPPWR